MAGPLFQFELNGRKVLGIDTGLDSRAFAQSKCAQFISEPGCIAGGGEITRWEASGIVELKNSEGKPAMTVWGPLFEGERLDLLLNDNDSRDKALAAICSWMDAVPDGVPLWPFAALIGDSAEEKNGAVFFAPPNLALRCLLSSGTTAAYSSALCYVHPDLSGRDAAAFTAAAMLYRVFAGTAPFSANDEIILRQDIREGNFLPARLAIPGINSRLGAAMQNALEGGRKAKAGKSLEQLSQFDELHAAVQQAALQHAVLQHGGKLSVDDFVKPLAGNALKSAEKEKARFIAVKSASVTTRRFLTHNRTVLLAGFITAAAALLVIFSIINSRASRPTTEGMHPAEVIETFLNAYGSLDHLTMESCVTGGAGKDDIAMVTNLYVINRVRMAYEMHSPSLIISASEWLGNGGGATEAQVFGVTGITINFLSGDPEGQEAVYRAQYVFWMPAHFT
ncbi:MAG: hypothetical protein FWH41_08835, partial [Treponema sp.]|nr:hypothetical protein [Treponema sp.]